MGRSGERSAGPGGPDGRRRAAGDALHGDEELALAVFERAGDAMFVADDDGRYVAANPAACRLLGREREELLRLTVADVSPRGADAAARWQAFVNAGSATGSCVVLRSDGEPREAEYSASAHVRPGRHLAILRDVTERRRHGSALWRAQRLESVGRLSGGIAHGFNNMLTAVAGYVQLLQGRLPEGSVEAEYAREIAEAAARASTLTAQLLAFGRRQVLQPRAVDVSRLVGDLNETLAELAGEELELVHELEPARRLVWVDPRQFERVVVSLVANAADACAEGGRITIRTGNHDVVERAGTAPELPRGPYVVLEVSDTCTGIPPHVLDHLFEPFFTTKEIGRGTGLGLAMAHGIVTQSGGAIAAHSLGDEGARFTVYLPEARPGANEELRRACAGDGECVLVVESDPAVRDVVFETLLEAGYRVQSARTGEEALALAAEDESQLDLLVAAVSLPGVDGPALVHELRRRQPGLPVLHLAEPGEALPGDALEAGARLLELPFTSEALCLSVRALIDAPQRRRPPRNG